MKTAIEQEGGCHVTVTRLRSPDGHPVVRVQISGGGTAMDTSVCLARLAHTKIFAGVQLGMVDIRESTSQADATGIFQQAVVLRRAGFRRLALSYQIESEAMGAVTSMVEEIFNAAGLPTRVGIHTSEAEALDWLDAQIDVVPA